MRKIYTALVALLFANAAHADDPQDKKESYFEGKSWSVVMSTVTDDRSYPNTCAIRSVLWADKDINFVWFQMKDGTGAQGIILRKQGWDLTDQQAQTTYVVTAAGFSGKPLFQNLGGGRADFGPSVSANMGVSGPDILAWLFPTSGAFQSRFDSDALGVVAEHLSEQNPGKSIVEMLEIDNHDDTYQIVNGYRELNKLVAWAFPTGSQAPVAVSVTFSGDEPAWEVPAISTDEAFGVEDGIKTCIADMTRENSAVQGNGKKTSPFAHSDK